MKVAIIGCGLIGTKRAAALGRHQLLIAADTILSRADDLSKQHKGSLATANWQQAAAHGDVDIVIVATTPNVMPEIVAESLRHGKHVLVEKPAARRAEEMDALIALAGQSGRQVRVGFNHRSHPALMKAHELIQTDRIGELMFIRGRYGHGGRLGYEKEWRADPEIAGGGELLDQGTHLIDLSRWFLGDFDCVSGFCHTYFWDMPVEDNGFMMLRTKRNQVAWLHASCTEWKNMFSFELYGQTGKRQVDGLGGSYGTERLTLYKMLPQMGPPEVETWKFEEVDRSWGLEFESFVEDIEARRVTSPNLQDAQECLRIVGQLYASSRFC